MSRTKAIERISKKVARYDYTPDRGMMSSRDGHFVLFESLVSALLQISQLELKTSAKKGMKK